MSWVLNERLTYVQFSLRVHWKESRINEVQKQPSRGVLSTNKCSVNMQQTYREHPYRSVISIKLQSNYIEITLRYRCFPVKLLYIFRTPFIKSICGRLLLEGDSEWCSCSKCGTKVVLHYFSIIKFFSIFLSLCLRHF